MTFMLLLGGVAAFWLARFLLRLSRTALPVCAGLGLALAAIDHGTGPFTAIMLGTGTGMLVLLAGQALYAAASGAGRVIMAIGFAAPAGFAGYHAARGIAGMILEPGPGLTAIGIFAAIATADAARRSLTRGTLNGPGEGDPTGRVS